MINKSGRKSYRFQTKITSPRVILFLFTLSLISVKNSYAGNLSHNEFHFLNIFENPIHVSPDETNLTPKNLDLDIDIHAILDFKKLKPQNKFRALKEKLLTLYTGKKEKINAAYIHGAYAINYTQHW